LDVATTSIFLAGFEALNCQHIAEVEFSVTICAELAEFGNWCHTCFFEVSKSGLGEAVLFLLTEANLNGVISVLFSRLDLCNWARTCFDDSNRDHTIRIVEYLCHTYLFTK